MKKPEESLISFTNMIRLNNKMIFNNAPLNILSFVQILILLVLPFYYKEEFTNLMNSYLESEKLKTFLVPIIIIVITYTIGHSLYHIAYALEHPFFEQYKCNKKDWPWKSEKKFDKKFKNSILISVINNLVLGPIFGLVAVELLGVRFGTSIADLPSFSTHFFQIIFMIILDDLIFYFSHRTLHTAILYKYIHSWHHDHKNSISLAAQYAHPVEFIFGNLVPTTFGAIVLGKRVHVFTYGCYVIFMVTQSIEAHGGYEFPWGMTHFLPFSCSVDHHDHHHRVNKGNFGSYFMVWDMLFGTNQVYFRSVDKEDKVKKDK